jgi:hypothetical protein
MVKQTIEV